MKAVLGLSILVIILLLGCGVESSSLIKSPFTNDLSGLFSLLFGLQSEQPDLKYDQKNHEWVEVCPDIDCQHGIDEGDCETCPSCLLGPEEECSDWKGKCGESLVCQYQSSYSSTGKCVLKTEFNSRKVGDSCGYWEGNCGDGLKCLVQSDSWAQFCGIEESGVCVTEEEFSSRLEGESCGDSAGECKEGLKCVQSDYCWFTSVCRNLTGEETEPHHHEHVISIDEVIQSSDSEGGQPEEHISIELVSDGDKADEEKLIKEIFESEFFNPFLVSEIKDETKEIEEMVHSVMTKSTDTKEETSSHHKVTKTIKNPEKPQTKTISIEVDSNESEFASIVFDAESVPKKAYQSDKRERSHPFVEIL